MQLLRQQNGQAFLLVRFVFRYLIRGIRTRALRKRHGVSFLAADRRLLQSIKTANQSCFAKDKNESLFLRQEIRGTANAVPRISLLNM